MTNAQLYLPTILPQWEIFLGVVLVIVGYVEKKGLLTYLGWIVLIIMGLTALYFNLSGDLEVLNGIGTINKLLVTTAWQATIGGVLAIVSLLMFRFKKKRYMLLSVLTLIYFVLTFFLYYQVSTNL